MKFQKNQQPLGIPDSILQKCLPDHLDLLADFPDWFPKQFPDKKRVVVFDKDETLISPTAEARVLHKNLVEEVLMPLSQNHPDICLVLYTLTAPSALIKDYVLFPEVIEMFDLIITGDNLCEETMIRFCNEGKLTGDPLLLEEERIKSRSGGCFHERNGSMPFSISASRTSINILFASVRTNSVSGSSPVFSGDFKLITLMFSMVVYLFVHMLMDVIYR